MIRVKLSEDELRKLRNFRIEKQLVASRVSTLLFMAPSVYTQYEIGTHTIPLEVLEKLAELYGKEEVKNFGVRVEGRSGNTRIPSFVSNTNKEDQTQKMVGILSTPEVYDFSKFKKTRTVQSDELNFYVPEKWKR